MAGLLGCSVKSIYYKAHALGLSKSEAFKASEQSGRILRGQKDPRMTATQFRAGHTTWNKGKPGTTGLHPNCRATQFKPGMKTNVLEQITLDRVECISMAENARRNHPRNKHPELAKLVQLKGAITRQVNRINREAQEATA